MSASIGRTKRIHAGNTFGFLLLLLGAAVSIYPLLWMAASSFKPELLIFKDKSLIIREFTTANYIRGLGGISGTTFFNYLTNTFSIVIPVVAGTVLSSSMTGYAFARCSFWGKKVFFGIMLIMMMLPMHAALVPRYVMFSKLKWLDTYLPMIVPSFLATNSFFVFLFVQFIRGIPREIDEAAIVDGCTPIGIFTRIIMPLSMPAVVTSATFAFIWTYDDFFSQMLYINTPSKYTVSLALRQYNEALAESAYGTLFAVSCMALVPLLLFFIFCQKYLVEGIATTGLKG